MLIDSHCHLDFPELAGDEEAVLSRARTAGVGGMLTIGTRLDQFERVRAIAERHGPVWCSVGVHPHEAKEEGQRAPDQLIEATRHPKVVGIGETGLDYYYDHSDRAVQQALFRTHIGVARDTGLPLIIHTRDAEADTLAILKQEMGKGAFPALIHCFTATPEFGRAVLDLGLTISLSGIVTFKNAKDLATFATEIPEDRLLVETDAPFLAPVPHRGKVCEPAFVCDTLDCIARLRGVASDALAETTGANFRTLFAKAAL